MNSVCERNICPEGQGRFTDFIGATEYEADRCIQRKNKWIFSDSQITWVCIGEAKIVGSKKLICLTCSAFDGPIDFGEANNTSVAANIMFKNPSCSHGSVRAAQERMQM